MIIDNFNLIKDILIFEDTNDFYFIQIIQRKKDIEGFKGNNRVIKNYYIFSLKEFEKRYGEIKTMCNLFNARAYIRLSRRNSEIIAKYTIGIIGEAFLNNSYNHIRKIYSTAAGRNKGKDKLWIIDLDGNNVELMQDVCSYINSLKPLSEKDKIIKKIPTKNGIHLISKPFDLLSFKQKYIDIDVHKNNPTILYCP